MLAVSQTDPFSVGTFVDLHLTPTEKAWIKTHPTIQVGDKTWPPFSRLREDGVWEGITVDYLEILLDRLGIQGQWHTGRSWTEKLMLLRDQKLDLMGSMVRTKNQVEYLRFTEPYFESPYVIVSRKDNLEIQNFEDLQGRSLAMEKDYALTNHLLQKYPVFDLRIVKNTSMALHAVSIGQVDAYIGSRAVAAYLIEKLPISNISIVTLAPFQALQLRIGVRKDWPELRQLLQKALASITSEEKARVRRKWLPIRNDIKVNYRMLLAMVAVVALVIGLIFLWLGQTRQQRAVLRESSQRCSRLIANIPGAIYQCALDDDRTMVFISESIKVISGYSCTDLIDNRRYRYADLIYPEDLIRVRKTIANGVSGQCSYTIEYRLKHAHNEIRWIFEKGWVHFSKNKIPLYLEGTIFDITDKKLAEQVLIQTNRFKSHFLANISYKVRVPMDTIIGMSHLILETKLSTEQHDYIVKIQKSANNLLSIVNNIFDFSKPEIKIIPLALDTVLADLSNLVTSKAEEQGLAIHFIRGAGIPNWLLGDPFRLGQILLHLVQNALKFTSTGEVRVAVTLDREETNCCWLDFEVTDSGIGIASERISALFEPFISVEGFTTWEYGNAGLDLRFCQQLVQLMGGQIKVKSKVNFGSQFSFKLPFVIPKQITSKTLKNTHQKQPTHYTKNSLLKGKALLVEDNEINQMVATGLLKNFGLTVSLAENGFEALDLLAEQTFDVVLMDIQMPGMNGWETTRRLRAEPRFKDLPIIAMTAHTQTEDREKCLLVGMSDYLSKPIGPNDLFPILVRWLGSKARQDCGQKVAPRAASISLLPATLAGVDLKEGLQLTGGNPEFYCILLCTFYRQHREDLNQLQAHLDCQDWKSARRLTHTLSGVAGNLGAKAVQKTAKILEGHIRRMDSKGIENSMAPTEQACQKLFEGLRIWNQTWNESHYSKTFPAKTEGLTETLVMVKQLATLLEESSSESLDYLSYLAGVAQDNPTLAKLVTILKTQVEAYEFEDALDTLEKLSQAMEIAP